MRLCTLASPWTPHSLCCTRSSLKKQKQCPPSELDERFLHPVSQPQHRGLPFFPDLHIAMSRKQRERREQGELQPRIRRFSSDDYVKTFTCRGHRAPTHRQVWVSAFLGQAVAANNTHLRRRYIGSSSGHGVKD
ncbi:hypothetical protein C0J45_13287 [Silurus meridionalis]|nr:hypothetical protein C0J45_13287 [Silurus meridionalis]